MRERAGRRRRASHSHDGIAPSQAESGGTASRSASPWPRRGLPEPPHEPAVAGERLLPGDLLLDDRRHEGLHHEPERGTRHPEKARHASATWGWWGSNPVGSSCSPERSGTRSSIHRPRSPRPSRSPPGARVPSPRGAASPARRACARRTTSRRRLGGSWVTGAPPEDPEDGAQGHGARRSAPDRGVPGIRPSPSPPSGSTRWRGGTGRRRPGRGRRALEGGPHVGRHERERGAEAAAGAPSPPTPGRCRRRRRTAGR